jgi:iron(III) transport system substrate-binding protein
MRPMSSEGARMRHSHVPAAGRNLKLAAGAAALSVVLVGCGGGAADINSSPAGGNGGGQQTAAEKVYASLNGMGAGARAAAVDGAKKEGELSLYTSMTSDVADAVSKAFTQQFGVKVNLYRANSETVLQRALQEGQANRPGADVYESDFQEMQSLQEQGRLSPYKGTSLNSVTPQAKLDGWTADRLNIFLPAWNTNLIKPGDEPKSWEDLADPKYKGKIQVELSDSDWYENLTHYWLTHGKTQQQVDQLWQGIAANSVTANGHTTMMQLLGAGQTAMDAMNYSYITDRAAQQGAPVADRGADGKTSVPGFPRPNGVGMEASAQHPNAAWLFNDWLLSDGQKILVNLHLTPVTKVAGDTSLDGITLVNFDVESLTKDSKAWSDKYDTLLRGVAAGPKN